MQLVALAIGFYYLMVALTWGMHIYRWCQLFGKFECRSANNGWRRWMMVIFHRFQSLLLNLFFCCCCSVKVIVRIGMMELIDCRCPSIRVFEYLIQLFFHFIVGYMKFRTQSNLRGRPISWGKKKSRYRRMVKIIMTFVPRPGSC